MYICELFDCRFLIAVIYLTHLLISSSIQKRESRRRRAVSVWQLCVSSCSRNGICMYCWQTETSHEYKWSVKAICELFDCRFLIAVVYLTLLPTVSSWTPHDESWWTQNQLQECGLQRLNVVFDIDFLGFLLGTGANCFLRGSVCRFASAWPEGGATAGVGGMDFWGCWARFVRITFCWRWWFHSWRYSNWLIQDWDATAGQHSSGFSTVLLFMWTFVIEECDFMLKVEAKW